MSQENVEIVREIYEDMNRRNWHAVLAAMDEDVVLVVHESVGPDAGLFRGRDAASRWFAEWFLAFDKDYRFDLDDLRSIGDRVFITARHHGHGRSSGADVEQVNAQVLSMRSGKVVQMELYGSPAEALKAVADGYACADGPSDMGAGCRAAYEREGRGMSHGASRRSPMEQARRGADRSARRARPLASGLLATGVAVLMLAVPGAAAPLAQAETVTRSYTEQGSERTFVVPPGVSSVDVVAIGGEGGAAGSSIGGAGARVSATLGVTPGETLYVEVGFEGNEGFGEECILKCLGGGGGGESDLRTAPYSAGLSPDPRILVAAGGGGAGGATPTWSGGEGGSAGQAAEPYDFAEGGGAGSQVEGGAGGATSCEKGQGYPGNAGGLEFGGAPGYCSLYGGKGAGEGGEGYYGGGGGGAGPLAAAGGGGGSSLVPAGGSVEAVYQKPQVSISYAQPSNAPAVTTGEASLVRETTATLNATVNPENEPVTSCTFEYGETELYGQTVACSPSPGSGIAPVSVSAPLSGLSANTTYHFRVTATNGSGTSQSPDGTFSTLSQEPPTVTSVAPANGPTAGSTSVTITGTNLENASAVRFGSATAGSFTVESPTTISAVSPAGTGTVDVTVTTPGGTSPIGTADRYTYIAPPGATTEPAGLVTQTSALLNAHVSSAASFTDCHFEYGTSAAYGTSVPCSSLPPAGSSAVHASVSGLSANTIYHFRISATSTGGTTTGADLTFATTGAPEYGRCLKVTTGTGTYGSATCTSAGGEKKYEWYPAFGSAKPLVKTHFTLAIKEKTTAKLVTQRSSAAFVCTGQTGSGEYTGNKTIGHVALTFSGCSYAATTGVCTSPGALEGEVVLHTLTGELGVIKTSTEGPLKNLIGTDLKPESGEVVATMTCGTTSFTWTGSVIGEVKRDGMVSKAPIKFTTVKLHFQKPTQFVGGPEEFLITQLGETAPSGAGLTLTTNQTDEEKIEVNSVV